MRLHVVFVDAIRWKAGFDCLRHLASRPLVLLAIQKTGRGGRNTIVIKFGGRSMVRSFSLSPGLLVPLFALCLVAPGLSQENSSLQPAYVRIRLPAGAELLVDGTRTKQTGSERLFESPPIPPGKKFI